MQSTSMYIQNSNQAGDKRNELLEQMTKNSTLNFFKKLKLRNITKGAVLGCGNGEILIELANRTHRNGYITGFDKNAKQLELTFNKAAKYSNAFISFKQLDDKVWEDQNQYDMVFASLHLNQINPLEALLPNIYQGLTTGGLFIAEDFDYSNHSCYPKSKVFDRYLELTRGLNQFASHGSARAKQLLINIQHENFKQVKVQMVRPSFLIGKTNRIASYTLQYISPLLIKQETISTNELKALLRELQFFELQKNTVITMPNIIQISAYKL